MSARREVLVAMSGGVDSSVAAALLREAGHDVTGVTLRLWGGATEYRTQSNSAAIERHDEKIVQSGETAGRVDERLKIIEANGAFIAFVVPPGHSTVDVVYRPRSFTFGAAASILTITSFAVALVRRRRILYS